MIVVGDALAWLAAMPSDSVHCVVTSPPDWGLRDYELKAHIWGGDPDCRHRWGAERLVRRSGGTGKSTLQQDGRPDRVRQKLQAETVERSSVSASGAFCARCGAWRGVLGLEPDYRLYVDHLVAVFREVRRVLRPDGALWLNLGDCYATGAGKAKRPGGDAQGENWQGGAATQPNRMPQSGLKPKDLVGIPWRVAFALQDDGWWLRRDNVRAKRNPMPEGCKDRCTSSHEYLFHLTKSARYFYDAEAIKEPVTGGAHTRGDDNNPKRRISSPSECRSNATFTARELVDRRNKRSVWTIATSPFAEAHFATFPPKLVEPCILAGTSAHGVCPNCAAPWERTVKRISVQPVDYEGKYLAADPQANGRRMLANVRARRLAGEDHDPFPGAITIGWRPTCKCGPNYADPIPATVLDPFLGAGTTGLVAARLGRDWIGIELSPAYADMARRRLGLAPQLLQKAA